MLHSYQGKDLWGEVKDIKLQPILFDPHRPHATANWGKAADMS